MRNYEKGLVSVIMPTYKRSDKLLRAIESVLKQTYKKIELLLVNDNEPEDGYTKELVKTVQPYINNSQFHLIMQKKHINGAVARNVGIELAKGEYIAFLDDDDWWEEEKISIQVKELEKLSSDWGGISCRIKRYNVNKLIMCQPLYKQGYVYKDILMLISDFETGTLLLRHEALDDVGYFDSHLLRHQDLQLLVNFTYKYKLKQVDALLHCRDISDAQNRPDIQKILNAKKEFFKSISPVLKTLTKNERKQIFLMHNAEIGYVYIKNKEYIKGSLKILRLIESPYAFYCEIKKVKEKILCKTKKESKRWVSEKS